MLDDYVRPINKIYDFTSSIRNRDFQHNSKMV